jgi:Ice-binding-like/PEP-CTERM motif
MTLSFCLPSAVVAGTITLGSAQSFAVLGGAGVTVGGANGTVVSGNLGDYPDSLSSITGFPTPGSLINGSFYASDSQPLIAQQARGDENTAWNALAGLASNADETGIILGTGGTVSTLLPGVYTFLGSAEVDGALTLNFNGQSNAQFVFQIATTLTTGSSASINVIGANPTDTIYWQVGTSATLGSSTAFTGNILATDAITLDPFASITCGRAFAYTASVTMADRNVISDDCSAASGSTPEPGTLLLLGICLAGIVLVGKRLAT